MLEASGFFFHYLLFRLEIPSKIHDCLLLAKFWFRPYLLSCHLERKSELHSTIYNIILPRVLIIDFFQPFDWNRWEVGSIAQSTKSWCQLGISSLICFFLFTICSATRISWQNERIDVAPNTTTALLRRAFQKWASLRAVWWWRQKNKWRDWRKKVRASIRSLLNIASCKFHIRVYVS